MPAMDITNPTWRQWLGLFSLAITASLGWAVGQDAWRIATLALRPDASSAAAPSSDNKPRRAGPPHSPATGGNAHAVSSNPQSAIRNALWRVTAYCPCEVCCGKFADGITASGRPVTAYGSRFVAAPPEIGFGTMLIVPGYADDQPVPVLDRGGAITGRRLDVFFPTHAEARDWGVRWLRVRLPGGQ